MKLYIKWLLAIYVAINNKPDNKAIIRVQIKPPEPHYNGYTLTIMFIVYICIMVYSYNLPNCHTREKKMSSSIFL